MPTRYIIIDDVDPSIHYNGLWFANQGNQNSVGDFGPPYNGTLHGTTSNASLSFEFSGKHHLFKFIKLTDWDFRNAGQSIWFQ